MYMMGENPFLSDPNINKVRKALAALEFLVVQDIFLTETAEFADVVLPATSFLEKDGTYTNTDRRVQIGRKVLDPPGEARPGLGDHPRDLDADRAADGVRVRQRRVRRDGRALARVHGPASTATSGRPASSTPTRIPEHSDGTVVLFGESFATDDGKAHLVPGRVDAGQGAAGRGVPVRAQHGPAARALAHRLDDPALVRARRDPAHRDGVHRRGRRGAHGHRRRRLRARELAPRLDRAGRQGLAPRDARVVLHPVPLPRGGGEPADDRRDRPDRQDPRVQVLRGEGRDDRPRGDVLPDSEQALQGAG